LDVKRIERFRAGLLACILALTLGSAPAAAEPSAASEAGIGALSALSSLIYGPVKIVYATCGLIVGGIAWGLSGGDSDVLAAVITPAVRGDYVITPSHLSRGAPLEFFGQDPAYRTSASRTAMAEEDPLVEDDY
jgi:hypothetical protein